MDRVTGRFYRCFRASSILSHINLNPVHARDKQPGTEKRGFGQIIEAGRGIDQPGSRLELDDITEDTKTRVAHDLAGQPAGRQADQQSNENAFVGYLQLDICI